MGLISSLYSRNKPRPLLKNHFKCRRVLLESGNKVEITMSLPELDQPKVELVDESTYNQLVAAGLIPEAK